MHVPSFPHVIPVLVAALLVAAAPAGRAATHRVPEDFPRVTGALAAAASGDTVRVGAGTYSTATNGEAFPLAVGLNDIVLLGAGMGVSVLDAGDQATVIEWTAPAGGRVSGFTVTRGRAMEGGGIRIRFGAPEVDHNLIIDNRAVFIGAGIAVQEQSTAHIHHNVLWRNTDTDVQAPGEPHNLYVQSGRPIIEHNLVGRSDGNGMLVAAGANAVIRNNFMYRNGIVGLRGRGICQLGLPAVVLAHNLFFGNAIAPILYPPPNGTGDMTAAGANNLSPDDGIYGNLEGDPLFVDEAGLDFHLLAGSPAIDAGDPISPPDPDGTVADIGPFYFDQGPGGVPAEMAPAARLTLAAGPNPFSGLATLTYSHPEAARVRLAVHDVAGRRVARLVDVVELAGSRSVVWDARRAHLGSGIYFARLEADGATVVRKLVLAE